MTAAADAALITRPRDDGETLAAALAARGFRPLSEPLLDIVFRPGPSLSRDGLQGLLATSANGVRALAARLGPELAAWRDVPVWTVGDASAAAARQLGFTAVASAGGDVARLAALVRERVDPAGGRLLQAAASALAGDLAGTLREQGFAVDRAVLYDAVPATRLSSATIDELERGRVAVALFLSPRTAGAFVRLATGRLAGACAGIAALALSPAVAAELAPLSWRRVRVAAAPNQASLLATLDEE